MPKVQKQNRFISFGSYRLDMDLRVLFKGNDIVPCRRNPPPLSLLSSSAAVKSSPKRS
jgi:hypothetical protein